MSRRLLPWCAAIVLALTLVALALNLMRTTPYLWPAGSGLAVEGEAHFTGTWGQSARILARPPRSAHNAALVKSVVPGSPSERAGVRPGDTISGRDLDEGDLSRLDLADGAPAAQWLDTWRRSYHAGLSAALTVSPQGRDERGTAPLHVVPMSAWSSDPEIVAKWMARYGGLVAQLVVFFACAVVLLAVRGDATASIAALALALCAVANSGPLQGAEHSLPWPLGPTLTVFAWSAVPLAFPCIALSIAYFPAQSPRLRDHPWLHAVPLLAVVPMLGGSLGTALYLGGLDSFAAIAAFDAEHPQVYYASFSTALAINLIALAEGVLRYRRLSEANERRRIRLALATTVGGVLAFAAKEGVAASFVVAGLPSPDLPGWTIALLDVLVLLPALGVTYAVTVHRVLSPRWFVRRSLQYAVAERTLTWLPVLATVPLTFSVYVQRDRTLADIASGAPALYATLVLVALGGFQVRTRARGWLDEHFFRAEYDARQILTSLAGRLHSETDPGGLAELVVDQLDRALHPRTVALLVGGLEEDTLVPVAVRHGSVESLAMTSPLVSMLRWSDTPLDIELGNPRAPVQRLAEDDREWLVCATVALLVPVLAQDRSLVGVLLLGEKQSDEAYDAEDKMLLSGVAAQVGLFLDVARLRGHVAKSASKVTDAGPVVGLPAPTLAVCPRCGLCHDASAAVCAADGARLELAPTVPRVIDARYQVEQRLGRGGMGEVYRAYDMRLDRKVAIKVLRAERHLHSDALGRFRREAQIVAKLQHPSIVAVYDFGTLPGGGAFLVMELVRGHDLRHHLRERSRFGIEQTRNVMTPACAAVAAAHDEGVLHRDLKPENILLTETNGDVKVLDFGIAKLLADEHGAEETLPGGTATVAGTILGTPAYMSPEQLRGEAVDRRSDVFSLGVLAYEMLSGELPFGSASLADIAVRQREPARSLSRFGVPAAIDEAVREALAYDRQDRPPSATAFAARFS